MTGPAHSNLISAHSGGRSPARAPAHRHIRAAAIVCILAAALAVLHPAPGAAQLIQLEPPAPTDPQTPGTTIPDAPPTRTIDPRLAPVETPISPLLQPLPDPSLRGRDGPDQEMPVQDTRRTELVPLRPRLPRSAPGDVIRLTGEATSAQFILFLPENPGAIALQIAHRSGIDALPDRSQLTVYVNGTEVGRMTPDNFSAPAIDALAIPGGVLRAGRNTVEIQARHTHRVACGPEASFALWTEIDPTASGIALPIDSFTTTPAGFLAALATQAGRGQPISIRRPDPGASLLDAAPFIAQVAAALGGAPPQIISAPYWDMAGAAPELARVTALPPGEGPATPSFVRGGDGAIVLLVERAGDYGAISTLLLSNTAGGGTAGARAAGMGPDNGQSATNRLTPGVSQTLDSLGSSSLVGYGRYVLMAVDFALPWDWVLLASQKARLDLDYRFAPDLPEGALLLVKVNGETVRLLPLDRDGGAPLPRLPIAFGARLLQPGVNRLEFEALIPGSPPDAACPQMDTPTLEVSSGSALFVPASPRMALPSIDMSLAMLSPDNIALTDNAAAQLAPGIMPQIAAALMRPAIPGATPANPNVRLTVASLADVGNMQPALPADSRRALQDALSTDFVRPANATSTAPPPPGAPATTWDMIDQGQSVFSLPAGSAIAEWPGRLIGAAAALIADQTPPLDNWLQGREGVAALLQPDPGQPGNIWLVFAPHANPSDIIRALAASQGSRDRPSGQAALYVVGEGWQNWEDPARTLILQEPVRWNNLRPVLGNYATRYPLGFLGAALFLTLLSAAIALTILKLTRKAAP